MDHNDILHRFYTSFSNGNSKGMVTYYHKDIVFEDPAFGKLKGKRAIKMWEMLLSRKSDSTKISFSNVQSDSKTGKVDWVAEYVYGPKKRKVVNKVSANFKFQDGKIIEHIDAFNLWKWSKQALGLIGFLLGWTPFMKRKIQRTLNKRLDDYMRNP